MNLAVTPSAVIVVTPTSRVTPVVTSSADTDPLPRIARPTNADARPTPLNFRKEKYSFLFLFKLNMFPSFFYNINLMGRFLKKAPIPSISVCSEFKGLILIPIKVNLSISFKCIEDDEEKW